MHKDNTPNFQTKLSKLTHFKDFLNNSQEEKDELKAVKRSFTKNDSGTGTDIGNKTKYKYNKVTRKMEDDSLPEIQDDIEALDKLGEKDTEHKYKIVSNLHQESNRKFIRTFESFSGDGEEELDNMHMQLEPPNQVEFESPAETQSYMFFGNLETIQRNVEELLEMDHNKVNTLLNDGHNWAEDHISTSKEMISHVYNFLMNHGDETNESEEYVESENYMFFANLENIHSQISELLELDHQDIDDLLLDGHDWAEDHIASAKENITQVCDFLKSEIE